MDWETIVTIHVTGYCDLKHRNRIIAVRDIIMVKGSASSSCRSDIQPIRIKDELGSK